MSVGRINRTGSVNGNSAFSLTKTHVSDCVLAEKPKILHKLDADRDTVEDAIVLLTENKVKSEPGKKGRKKFEFSPVSPKQRFTRRQWWIRQGTMLVT